MKCHGGVWRMTTSTLARGRSAGASAAALALFLVLSVPLFPVAAPESAPDQVAWNIFSIGDEPGWETSLAFMPAGSFEWSGRLMAAIAQGDYDLQLVEADPEYGAKRTSVITQEPVWALHDLVATPDGTLIVAYTQGDDSECCALVVQRSNDAGRTWMSPVQWDPPEGRTASYPILLFANGAGVFMVENTVAAGTGSDEPLARILRSQDEGATFEPIATLPEASRVSAVAERSEGGLWLAGQSGSAFEPTLYQLAPADGEPWQLTTTVRYADFHPSDVKVAEDANGQVIMMWSEMAGSQKENVWLALPAPASGNLEDPVAVGSDGRAYWGLRLATDGDGRILAVWHHADTMYSQRDRGYSIASTSDAGGLLGVTRSLSAYGHIEEAAVGSCYAAFATAAADLNVWTRRVCVDADLDCPDVHHALESVTFRVRDGEALGDDQEVVWSVDGVALAAGEVLEHEFAQAGDYMVDAVLETPDASYPIGSCSVQVPNLPPVVEIALPEEATAACDLVPIVASASDPYGRLRESRLTVDGEYRSTGGRIEGLTPGVHEVVLTAVDEGGLTATATGSIEVLACPRVVEAQVAFERLSDAAETVRLVPLLPPFMEGAVTYTWSEDGVVLSHDPILAMMAAQIQRRTFRVDVKDEHGQRAESELRVPALVVVPAPAPTLPPESPAPSASPPLPDPFGDLAEGAEGAPARPETEMGADPPRLEIREAASEPGPGLGILAFAMTLGGASLLIYGWSRRR